MFFFGVLKRVFSYLDNKHINKNFKKLKKTLKQSKKKRFDMLKISL